MTTCLRDCNILSEMKRFATSVKATWVSALSKPQEVPSVQVPLVPYKQTFSGHCDYLLFSLAIIDLVAYLPPFLQPNR